MSYIWRKMKTRKNQNDKFMNIPIPNAFIFCPVVRAFQCKKTLEKGIFVCENEMDDVEETESSIFNEFSAIQFSYSVLAKSMVEAIQEYVSNATKNEEACKESLMFVARILSYDRNEPIEIWFKKFHCKQVVAIQNNG